MLTLKNVCWKPEDGEAVLRGIDLQVQTGKLTVVTGPNGGGKTSSGQSHRRIKSDNRRQYSAGME